MKKINELQNTDYAPFNYYGVDNPKYVIIAMGSVTSVGASGAIFGLLGAMLYFGFHYRAYFGQAVRLKILPVIGINLLIGFMMPNIDNWCHIGGLVGGFLITMALGVNGKSKTSDLVNGSICSVIYFGFLMYLLFFR